MTTMFLTLGTFTCANCGLAFGLTAEFEAKRRKDKQSFYCPNGHSQYFPGETDEQKQIRQLREQLAAKERDRAAAESGRQVWRQRAESTERRLRGTKAVVTRMRKRAAAGVCPVEGCKRHFANLQRHIATKHPERAHKSRTRRKARHA